MFNFKIKGSSVRKALIYGLLLTGLFTSIVAVVSLIYTGARLISYYSTNEVIKEFQSGNYNDINNEQINLTLVEGLSHAERLSKISYFLKVFQPIYQAIPIINLELISFSDHFQKSSMHAHNLTTIFGIYIQIQKMAHEFKTDNLVNHPTDFLNQYAEDIDPICVKLSDVLSNQRFDNENISRTNSITSYIGPIRKLHSIRIYAEETLALTSETCYQTVSLIQNSKTLLPPFIKLLKTKNTNELDIPLSSLSSDLDKISESLQQLAINMQLLQNHDSGIFKKMSQLDEYLIWIEQISRFTKSLSSIIEPLPIASYGSESIGDALIDTMEAIDVNHQIYQTNLANLKDFGLFISNSKLSDNNDTVKNIGSSMASVVDMFDHMKSISPHGPHILGVYAPKHYLILGHSSDELRPTGGFISAVWIVTVYKGSIAKVEYFDVVELDNHDKIESYPTVPPSLNEHMGAWVWLMRDVSWYPEFFDVADTAIDMFKLSKGAEDIQIDGVIAVNQWALLEILGAMKAINYEETHKPINETNLIETLEQGSDVYGRSYADIVMNQILDEATKTKEINEKLQLVMAFHKSITSKDLMFYFTNQEINKVMYEMNWGGNVKQFKGDYLYVSDSNIGWSKVDRNIERRIQYSIDLSDNLPSANLNLSYKNHSDERDAECEPQWRERGKSYSDLKNACYWNFFRILLPKSHIALINTPKPIPQYSLSVENGHKQIGQETIEMKNYRDKLQINGVDIVAPGASSEISLNLELDPSTITTTGKCKEYRLLIQKQPGVLKRETTLKINLPPKVTVLSKPDFMQTVDGSVVGHLILTKDEYISIKYSEDMTDTCK